MIDSRPQRSSVVSDAVLVRRVWNLSWPIVLWSALEASLGLADLLMVRSLGPEATAAIGVSRQVTFLVDSIALAIASGIIAVVSQAVGSNRWDTVIQVVRQSGLLLVILALPVGVLGFFVSPTLLAALNADGPTMAGAVPYMQIYFLGILFSWASVVGAAFFRSMGNAMTPLKLATVVACLNVPLNYVLIYGVGPLPELGVKGAALGSLVAKVCSAVVYVVLLSRLEATHATSQVPANLNRLDMSLLKRILRIGTPMALAGLVRNGSRLVFLAIVGAGSTGMALQAAVGVGLQVRLLSVLPALAFQVATATLVGQAIGRDNYEEARRLGRRSVQLLATIMLVIVTAIIIYADPLARMLVGDETVAEVAVTVLRWLAVAQFFSALNITVQGALLGAGDTAANLRYTVLTQWIVMLPLAYMTSDLPLWQLHGPLAAWTIAPILLLVLVSRRFQGEKWKTRSSRRMEA